MNARNALVISILSLVPVLGGCPGCGPMPEPDAGPPGEDGGPDGGPGGEDGGPEPDPVTVTDCGFTFPDTGSETCVVEGSGGMTSIRGAILRPGEVLLGGAVVFDENGDITCTGCECDDSAATRVLCPDASVSPGLINAHDHMGWMGDSPAVPQNPDERYEHRHDWRRGLRGHTEINTSGSASGDEKAWGELRMVLSGATSINGSGQSSGLMRNLDGFGGTVPELGISTVAYETFPLGDSGGNLRADDCSYPDISGSGADAFTPHVSEGIDREARNEFLCLTSDANGGMDVLDNRSALIHGVGLLPLDVATMAERGIKLIWSPRSNVSLYGDTAQIPLHLAMGVEVGMGTDWMPSGSMNMLRELQCADTVNQLHWNGAVRDDQLWRMVTLGGARSLAAESVIGLLEPGRKADVAIFRRDGAEPFRAVIDADEGDVALVLRGGEVLSGDAALVEALESGCDVLSDVCGVDKRVCLTREIGSSLSQLTSAVGSIYPLFGCGAPMNEPTCIPARVEPGDSIDGSTLYQCLVTAEDSDGDGIDDASDNCPTLFNPIRPVDEGSQGDADADGLGDLCDPCPLAADTTDCPAVNLDDGDGDGFDDIDDNCPRVANADQADADGDNKGDVCDACPDDANPGAAGCPAVVYEVKDGTLDDGERVRLTDMVVTARDGRGFFAQLDPSSSDFADAPDSGIYTFVGTADNLPARWERISLDGTVATFFDQRQLTDAEWTVDMSVSPLTPLALASGDVTAAVTAGGSAGVEGLLVEVSDVTVTDATPAPGAGAQDAENEVEVTGGLRVDDAIYALDPLPGDGETFSSLVGVLSWRNALLKLLPRDAADVTYGPPEVAGFNVADAFVRVGAAAGSTFPAPLTIELVRTVSQDTTVTLSSDDGGVASVPATVTVQSGQSSAEVLVTGGTAGDATISAQVQGGTAMATVDVHVIADDAAPTTVTVTPADSTVPFDGTLEMTVELDIPAPVGGVDVALSVTNSAGSVPATVPLAENELSATFTFTAGSSTADGEVVPVVGAATATSATVHVVDPATLSLDLEGYTLLQQESSMSLTLPAGTSISVGGYLVVGRNASKAEFESFWGVTLAPDVTYVDAGNSFIAINGDETYEVRDDSSATVDGPTTPLTGEHLARAVPVLDAGDAGSWTSGTPTPGTGQTPDTPSAGLYVSEVADATGTGNFVYEFVELYYDGP